MRNLLLANGFAALTPALLALAVAGCDSGTPGLDGTYEVRRAEIIETAVGETRLAWVDINGTTVSGVGTVPADREVSDEPVAVRAGVPFDVTVYTFTGPRYRAAPSEVAVEGRTATVAVHDSVYVGVQNAIRTFTPRTDRVAFAAPGEAEVVVRGVEIESATATYVDRELRFPVVVTE